MHTPRILTLIGLALGTLTAASAHHWMTAWLGLEINMISMLPIIVTQKKHPRPIEAATKYFLTQAVASSIMLFSATLNAWQTGSWGITQLDNKIACSLMIFALSMKLAAAPAHFWLPEVAQGANWFTMLLMLTWQKIAPITLTYLVANHIKPEIMLLLGLLSIMMGAWGIINQTQLRKMMAYSSMVSIGWTLMIMTTSPNLGMTNAIIYTAIAFAIMALLKNNQTKSLRDLTATWNHDPATTTILALLLLSMAGLPPLTGFMPKLLIMDSLITHKLTLMAATAALLSLLNLVFYLRMVYLLISTSPPVTTQSFALWRLQPHKSQVAAALVPPALFSMMILPTVTL
uniref:NADH-ubiquinone oxidoreductase chain 2 n=1 Tax=Tropicagama temporalis TaxID=103705 RepID=F6KXU0_TROTE|nr:NADH dehydrogenase subunit 2 [Tropicagama temporalis]